MNFIFCLVDRDGVAGLRAEHAAAERDYLAAVNDRIFWGGTLYNEKRTEAKGSLYVIDLPDRAAAEAWFAEEPYRKAGLYKRAVIRCYKHAVPRDGLSHKIEHKLWAYVQLDVPHGQDLRKIHIKAHHDYLVDTTDVIYSDGPVHWDSDGIEFEDRIGSIFVVDFPDLAAAEAWRTKEPFTVEGVYGQLFAHAFELEWPTA
jgi:uncharacterized protein YciI